MKGREGFPISGFLPYRHAYKYQRRAAATRSNRPIISKMLHTAPASKQLWTKSG